MAKPWMRWVVGVMLAFVALLVFAPLHHIFGRPPNHKQTATLSNAKQIALATLMYTTDYDDRLPHRFSTSDHLVDSLLDYTKYEGVFVSHNPAGSIFLPNQALAGLEVSRIMVPAHTALVFETAPWADGRTCYAFVDGHARRVTDTSLVIVEPVLRDEED